MSQQSTKGMPDAHELSIKIHFIKDCIGVEQALRQFQADTVAACAAISRHFADDELTAEEWPRDGLYDATKRCDFGHVKMAGDNIAVALEKLADDLRSR